ncbi:MAG: hypothetical protein ABFS38_14820 [Bacteroidota bacterium]
MSKLKRKVRRMWWDIKDVSFVGTNISRKNGMFMSAANSVPVGSVYDITKKWGFLSDNDLVFSYSTLKEKYLDYPDILNESAKPPSKFTLDSSNEIGVDVLGSMVDSTSIANISAELSMVLKNAMQIVVNIKQWGIDYVEEGEISVFLSAMANANDPRIKQILDGDNVIATRGVWVKGMSFGYKIDKETIAKVKSILETKQQELLDANINLDIKSELELDFDFEYDKKFYPFFKFREIKYESKDDYYLLASADLPDNDVFLDDVNFAEYIV